MEKMMNKKPIYIQNEQVVFVDIDDTLVMKNFSLKAETIEFNDPYDANNIIKLSPHEGHIKLIKDFYVRNHTIIAWSANGAIWAKEVIEKLNLSQFITIIMTKPIKYVDDLQAEEILGQRIYLKFQEKYHDNNLHEKVNLP